MQNKPYRIAIQGIAASFHEQASLQFFQHQEIETVECLSFRAVAEALRDGHADYAVLAIENSIAGSILGNYRLMQDFHFKTIGEIYLHIQMNLMAVPGTNLEDIKNVYSHPIALQQCHEFLHTLPDVQLIDFQDTASAAKMLKEKGRNDAAAVASKLAAEQYGLEILEPRIETNKRNFTRFLVLSRKHETLEEVQNKASISFLLGTQVGELADVLLALSQHNINLTKVQSVPVIGKPSEYTFYLDLVWESYEDYSRALDAVLRRVSSLSLLGEYGKGEMRYEG